LKSLNEKYSKNHMARWELPESEKERHRDFYLKGSEEM